MTSSVLGRNVNFLSRRITYISPARAHDQSVGEGAEKDIVIAASPTQIPVLDGSGERS